jgi:hypothetical protein
MEALLEGGAFDDFSQVEGLAELSMSRMGYDAMHQLAHKVNVKLRARGLAKESEDGVSIPMHPHVRSTYLLILAQLARETGARHHLDLHPVTNGRGSPDAFRRLLELEPMPSRGQVVAFDLEVVAPDLADIPLDDVLEFKKESGGAHRRYMQDLRKFTLELGAMDEADRVRALNDRRADLQDEARDLRQRSLKAWRSPKDVTRLRARHHRRRLVARDSESSPGGPWGARRGPEDAPEQGRPERLLVPVRRAQEAAVAATQGG